VNKYLTALKARNFRGLVSGQVQELQEAPFLQLLQCPSIEAPIRTTQRSGNAYSWRIRYPGSNSMEVIFAPAATQAEVVAIYSGASVEALPETPPRAASPAEVSELKALISAVLVDAEPEDRDEALRVACADPDAALVSFRTLAGHLVPASVDTHTRSSNLPAMLEPDARRSLPCGSAWRAPLHRQSAI
jgi:hypothetical protein